ncbi:uncharacterized protein N7443_005903 [Penicillium atrosanguineum]|uniref:4-coumarate-CoA ligase n=1 Tax=Penicillium atrosanguineum TaxID=1132637 RepID=A0A9W9U302_9EURO|nr:uncharacterized protein N7443_005903 [Penicillium atrosanguineum]KAJ5128789.1 hypothetical protein N7526_006955 [Penicillium atrosanguineum]KAJ5300901.1 hypothetical protein N7443_005903 [Penicillium atrosanguineum]KAJ5311546.1 hypothetical protein N7476_007406 [Penicillium atrosanguineum]
MFKSVFPTLDIPKTNILSYLYPTNQTVSDNPIWIDAEDPAKSLSPRQMLSWVRRLGFGLDRLGVEKGEVVMIITPNHIFVPVAYQGIAGSGRIFSGANPIYKVPEIQHQLKNTSAKVILTHPSLIQTVLEAARGVGFPEDRIFQFSDRPCRAVYGILDWREMLGSEEEANMWKWDDLRESADSTIATINYSSGTTGLPKGVCVSHYNLIANVEQSIFTRDQETPYAAVPGARPAERWVGFLPLYHAYGKMLPNHFNPTPKHYLQFPGQLYANLMAGKLGVPIYIMQKFVFEDFLRVIQKYRITNLQVAPPILIMLDKRPETSKFDLSSIKNILCGAAPLSRELQNTIQKNLKLNVVQSWGMTELTCSGLYVPGGRTDDSGSIGMLVPNCQCKILDEEGKIIYAGEPGELYIRGPNVCMGYWKNEQATRESLDEEGWLKTGDVVIVRDNSFWVVDRKKELIKVNGLQVAPAELEAVLLEHADVADAGVVGITINEEERPRAYVRLQDGPASSTSKAQIQDYMKIRVAKHKQLTGGVIFVEEVPRLASGKIQRKVLKEWAKRDAELPGPQLSKL